MYFVINKSSNGQYFFTAKADNHQTLCHSETYIQKQSAEHAINVIINEARYAETKDNT